MKCVVGLNDVIFSLLFVVLVANAKELDKDEVDKVIEDEITEKLSEDLLQSIEKKFHVDLERSVDSVLQKIKFLLQNGTVHIQEKLAELQSLMTSMRNESSKDVDNCLAMNQNETTALAEKALHQMVVCGYALIGHDPAQAVRNVMELKAMIKRGLSPMYKQRTEIYNLLRVCGHEQDSLKKVIKCVIAKSPQLKSAMMGVSSKLIDGVVQLTKQMAHGAMHEACLIEVIKTIEEEAFSLMGKVKLCTTNETLEDVVHKYIDDDNATVIDVTRDKNTSSSKEEINAPDPDKATQVMLRRMLQQSKAKQALLPSSKVQQEMGVENNAIGGNDPKKNTD